MSAAATPAGLSPAEAAASRRLALWNGFMLYLLRASRQLKLAKKAGEAVRHRPINTLFYQEFNPRSTIGIVSLRLSRLSPQLKDITYVVYVSAQYSKKKVPAQAERIVRRLKKADVRGDTMKILLAPRGASRGAFAVLKRSGIHVVREPRELLQLFRKYIERRAEKLVAALRGKRIFGDVALIALVLFELLNALHIRLFRDTVLIDLYDAVVRGRDVDVDVIYSAGAPPPPQE